MYVLAYVCGYIRLWLHVSVVANVCGCIQQILIVWFVGVFCLYDLNKLIALVCSLAGFGFVACLSGIMLSGLMVSAKHRPASILKKSRRLRGNANVYLHRKNVLACLFVQAEHDFKKLMTTLALKPSTGC